MRVNERLKIARIQKCKSQREVAEDLEISESTIIRLEHYQSFPQPEYLRKICEYYGMSPDALGLIRDDYVRYKPVSQGEQRQVLPEVHFSVGEVNVDSGEHQHSSEPETEALTVFSDKSSLSVAVTHVPSTATFVSEKEEYQIALNKHTSSGGNSPMQTLRNQSPNHLSLRWKVILTLVSLIAFLAVTWLVFSLWFPPLMPQVQFTQVKPPLLLLCGDCEQPNLSPKLTTIITKTTNVTLRFEFTNESSDKLALQFTSIKLTDPSGNDYSGVGDPFYIGPGQSVIENVTFPHLQPHLVYTLSIVVSWHNHLNYYLPTTVNL